MAVIKDKTADLRNLVEKSLECINPETSDIKATQIMNVPRGNTGINVQNINIIGQQVIFNLTMCLAHIVEIEAQLEKLDIMAPDDMQAFDRMKRVMMITALENNNWLQKAAAKDLGMSPRAFHYALNKYKINDPQGRWRLER